jgi:hypothetical protein
VRGLMGHRLSDGGGVAAGGLGLRELWGAMVMIGGQQLGEC